MSGKQKPPATNPGASVCPGARTRERTPALTVTDDHATAFGLGHNGSTGDKMELHGVTGKPYKHPQVRRTVPTFTRASISVGAVRRSWKDTPVAELAVGDTVAQFGTLAEVSQFVRHDSVREDGGQDVLVERPSWRVKVHNVMGETREYPGEQRVFAFTKDRRG